MFDNLDLEKSKLIKNKSGNDFFADKPVSGVNSQKSSSQRPESAEWSKFHLSNERDRVSASRDDQEPEKEKYLIHDAGLVIVCS